MTDTTKLDEVNARCLALLSGRTLTNVFMCEGNDAHSAHIDLEFGDRTLMLYHTEAGVVLAVSLGGESAENVPQPHDCHPPCEGVQ